MNYLGRVHELNTLQNLIQNEPLMDILQNFLSDCIVEVSLHELKDKIKILIVFRSQNVG